MELSVQTKTYLVLGIMVCCFAVLYPKIFHPMIMAGLGMRQSQPAGSSASGDWPDGVHPRLRRPPMPGGGGGGPGGNPAAARMAAEHAASMQARQQQQTGGLGGRGNVVGLILPVYAVGIVLYLVYTLVKVMGGFKSNNNSKNGRNGKAVNDYYKNFHFDPLSGEFVDNASQGGKCGARTRRNLDDDEDEDVGEQNRYERMHRDLEKLLRRVDDQDISENELVQLRSRLEETERQMTSILGAMQTLQQHKQQASADAAAAAAASPSAEQAGAKNADDDADQMESETRQRKPFSLAEGDQ